MFKTFRLFSIFTLSFSLFLPLTQVMAAEKPGQIVIDTIDRGLKILNDPELQGMDNYSIRRKKLWNTVSPVFNFEETSRRALGAHWRKRTPEEKQDFISTFKKILKNMYLSKSDSYQGERIEYVREIVRGNKAKVQSHFYTADQKKVVIDFSMKKNSETWKVYDISIEGVSMIGNYREQFNSILTNSTFAELMKKLKTKEGEIDE